MIDFASLKLHAQQQLGVNCYVDLNAFDANINQVAALLKSTNKSVRIATKSLRVPALIKRVLEQLPQAKGLMCYSAQEAIWLANNGFDNLFIAYPVVLKAEIALLAELAKIKKIILTIDSLEHLKLLAPYFSKQHPVAVIIDVDGSLSFFKRKINLGVFRSPIQTIASLAKLISEIQSQYSMVRLEGVMVYEAQVAGLTDRNPYKPFLNWITTLVRKISIKKIYKLRKAIASYFNAQSIELKIFNGGGTGSLNIALAEPWLTEVTVGSAFLQPHLFDYYSNIKFQPAAFFGLPITRQSDQHHVTCFGGGYIASGEPGWDKVPKIVYPPQASLVLLEGCGEVQTPVQTNESLALADIVFFRHAKAGELFERFNHVHLVANNNVIGAEKTYRGLGLSFG